MDTGPSAPGNPVRRAVGSPPKALQGRSVPTSQHWHCKARHGKPKPLVPRHPGSSLWGLGLSWQGWRRKGLPLLPAAPFRVPRAVLPARCYQHANSPGRPGFPALCPQSQRLQGLFASHYSKYKFNLCKVNYTRAHGVTSWVNKCPRAHFASCEGLTES